MNFENKRDAEDYSVLYTKLKERATNFMSTFAVTLAWAHLIHRRTEQDGDKPMDTLIKWSQSDYDPS